MGRSRLVIGAVAACLGLSACWLQPRVDAGRTGYQPGEATLTPATVGDLDVLWQTALSSGVQDPVTVDGGVYGTTSSGTAARLDAATGEVAWRRELGAPGFGYALEDPALLGGELLVPFSFARIGGLYRLDTGTGDLTPASEQPSPSATIDVAVVDGAVARLRSQLAPGLGLFWIEWGTYQPSIFFQFGTGAGPGRRFAIVGERVLWSFGNAAQGYSPACPALPPGGPTPPGVKACSADWSTDLGGLPAPPAAVGGDGVVYADDTGTVTVLDVVTGAVRWTAEVGAPVQVAPAVADGAILVATADGRLVSLPAGGCGAAVCPPSWEAPVGGEPRVAPTVGGDVAYTGTAAGDVVAVDADGCGTASCAPLATVAVGAAVTGGPVVHDGRVLVGAGGSLLALGLPG